MKDWIIPIFQPFSFWMRSFRWWSHYFNPLSYVTSLHHLHHCEEPPVYNYCALNAWLLQASNLFPVYSFWIRLMGNRRNGLGIRNFELNLTKWSDKYFMGEEEDDWFSYCCDVMKVEIKSFFFEFVQDWFGCALMTIHNLRAKNQLSGTLTIG